MEPAPDETAAERGGSLTLAPVRWRVWPTAVNSVSGWLVLIVCSATIVLTVWRVTARWELATLAWMLAALASWKLWLPMTYELSFQGLGQRLLGRESRLPWPAISKAEIGSQGVWLWSHDDGDSGRRLLGFLPWGDERELVLNWFESRRLAGRRPVVIEADSGVRSSPSNR